MQDIAVDLKIKIRWVKCLKTEKKSSTIHISSVNTKFYNFDFIIFLFALNQLQKNLQNQAYVLNPLDLYHTEKDYTKNQQISPKKIWSSTYVPKKFTCENYISINKCINCTNK